MFKLEEEMKEFAHQKKEEVIGLSIKEEEDRTVSYDNALIEKLKVIFNSKLDF
jgi:hypothetical protein